MRLLAGARYAVNPSRYEAYSIFAAEALIVGVPTITTPDVTENLVAEQTPVRYGLVLVTRAMISTWETNPEVPQPLPSVIGYLDKAVKRIACKHMIHAYAKLYGFRAAALRYANVVGPKLRHGVIWDFTNTLLRN